MSSTALDWYKSARDDVEALPGVSAQIQAHLLLELCMRALPDGHIPTARTRDVAEWLMVSKPTAKKVIQALVENQLIENLGGGSLRLSMCDNVGEKETEFQNVGKNESELPQNFQNVGKKETQFQNVGKNESECRESANPDNILNPRTYYVSTRERVRAPAHTREAAALAPPSDLSGLDVSETQIVLADYHRVFEHGLGLSLSPSKQSLVLRSCAEHGVETVRKAIREFEAEMIDAREDPARQAWAWDRNKRPVPLHILTERIEKTKMRAVAVAQKNSRRPNGQRRGYTNDVWADALAEGERDKDKPPAEPTNWREIKSCP